MRRERSSARVLVVGAAVLVLAVVGGCKTTDAGKPKAPTSSQSPVTTGATGSTAVGDTTSPPTTGPGSTGSVRLSTDEAVRKASDALAASDVSVDNRKPTTSLDGGAYVVEFPAPPDTLGGAATVRVDATNGTIISVQIQR